MKKQLLRLLLCAGLLAGLFTVTALAADWTYDPTAQTLTHTLSSDTVVLKNVTDDGSGKLTIGSYQNFTGAALDLTGQITDSDGNTYAITALGGSAFHGCGTLTTVALPESLTSIETYAFYSCSDLATVDFSRCTNLTIIDMYAFSNCTSLAAVDLSGCTSLSTIEGYTFQTCGLTTMDLSGCTNLSSIGQCTFTSCDDLTSMTLPNSLTGIGDEAFYGCSNLDELVLLSKNPPTLGEDALLAVSQDFRIIVPEENAEAYKTAEGWKDVAGSVHGLTYQLEVTPPNGSLEIFRGEPPRGQIPRR